MRYSVLLPTRNGGKFLRNCIDSILSQDGGDYELVISDNANDDETPAIIDGYRRDPRVVTLRLEEPVPVTDNWNAALRASSGDYILMMGDDDFLLPGYFRRMDAILERHGDPDCVLYNGYSFVAPDSIGGDSASFYSPRHFEFGPDLQTERQLSADEQLGIVRDMFHWRIRIPLNMQTTLVARRAGERIEGGFFQPPFPDHYALNALLVTGARWIFSPERLVVVGVSPKSFGHYVYSSREASGLAYLGIDPKFPGQLPGSPLLNGMHEWLDRLLATYPHELAGVRVDRRAYVRRQIYNWLMQMRFGGLSWREVGRRVGRLPAKDWIGLAATPFDGESWRRLASLLSRKTGAAQTQWKRLRRLDGIANIAEFSKWLDQTSNPTASNTSSKRRTNAAFE